MEYRMQTKGMAKPNFMTFDRNKLFHFTTFESALKIISSRKLIFGDFSGMNDISESRRDFFIEAAEKELQKYRSISFTIDKKGKRAFEIDPLWGYYSEKGNGVCLAFDKSKIISAFKKFRCFHKMGAIHYLKEFTNAILLDEESSLSVGKQIENDYKNIFFTKSKDWSEECEYRFLIKNEGDLLTYLNFSDALIAIIICLPRYENVQDSCEYQILKKLTELPILHYHT